MAAGKCWIMENYPKYSFKPQLSAKPRKDNGQYISPFSFKDDQFKPEVDMLFWILCIKRKIVLTIFQQTFLSPMYRLKGNEFFSV